MSKKKSKAVTIDGNSLEIADVRAVATDGAKVELSKQARARMLRTREIVEKIVDRGDGV
jgi:histidine ammonia-lyase